MSSTLSSIHRRDLLHSADQADQRIGFVGFGQKSLNRAGILRILRDYGDLQFFAFPYSFLVEFRGCLSWLLS